jgi:outer membrane protein assembly factor BamB
MKHISVIGTVILISTIFIIGCHKPEEIKDDLKWQLKIDGNIEVCPAIGSDGTIYFGTDYGHIYAVNPNGSVKWCYDSTYDPTSAPAIGTDGTIYIAIQGVSPDTTILPYLYAFNSNGLRKWRYLLSSFSNLYCHSSPAIGADGTIYVGTEQGDLYAINADSSLKWLYHVNRAIYSSPAIGADGTIYFGCNDSCMYAINPNGNLQWRYLTNGIIKSSSAIDAQGTLYFSSADQYLYALNANGTLKWRYNVTDGYLPKGTSPSIGEDGTIYYNSYGCDSLFAINPNGTLKWEFSTANTSLSLWNVPFCPTVCSDSTILVYTYRNGDYYCFCAIQSDGTMAWYTDKHFGAGCNVTIGADSTIYAGTEIFTGWTTSDFYLYALNGQAVLDNSAWPKFHHDLKNTGRVGGF